MIRSVIDQWEKHPMYSVNRNGVLIADFTLAMIEANFQPRNREWETFVRGAVGSYSSEIHVFRSWNEERDYIVCNSTNGYLSNLNDVSAVIVRLLRKQLSKEQTKSQARMEVRLALKAIEKILEDL